MIVNIREKDGRLIRVAGSISAVRAICDLAESRGATIERTSFIDHAQHSGVKTFDEVYAEIGTQVREIEPPKHEDNETVMTRIRHDRSPLEGLAENKPDGSGNYLCAKQGR